MEPAARIIADLGGPTEVSKEIGVHRTRVSNWKRSREVGSTGGIIPQKHIPALLDLARKKGVTLSVEAFFVPLLASAEGSSESFDGPTLSPQA